MTFEQFVAHDLVYDAVVRCLSVVGEAAWKLSKEFQALHPDVPWILVATMRHRLIHDYGGIDKTIVYRSAREYLPNFVATCKGLLED